MTTSIRSTEENLFFAADVDVVSVRVLSLQGQGYKPLGKDALKTLHC
jgi:hypothetical protein